MKIHYALALAGILLVPVAQADDHKGAAKAMAAHVVDDADDDGFEKLKLNDEQKAKFEALRAEEKAKREAVRDEYRAKKRALLNPDQQKAFDENQKTRKEIRKDIQQEFKGTVQDAKAQQSEAKDALKAMKPAK